MLRARLDRQNLVLALALAVAAFLLFLSRDFFHDDAFITLRYVQRWLSGGGLAWTAGDPIEGYTHPLWLIQLAALGLVGVPLTLAPRILGVLYLLAIFALWARRRVEPIPLLALVTLPGVAAWTLGGLETLSFAFWSVLGCAALGSLLRDPGRPRRALGVGFLFFLAALTRPEGMGLGVLAIAWVVTSRSLRSVLGTLVGFALPLGLFLLGRYAFYGELLSTSSIVKLGGFGLWFDLGNGLDYLWRNCVSGVFSLYCVLAAGLGERRREALVPLAMAAALVGATVAAGGDHMGYARFLVPVFVLLAWAAASAGTPRRPASATAEAAAAEPAAGAGGRGAVPVGLAWKLAIAVNAVAWAVLAPLRPDAAAALGAPVGRFLSAHLPAGSLVALATAGSTPYHAPEIEFIDTLGLNDPVIARRRPAILRTAWQLVPGHQKGDGAYVLARAPDVIILGPATGYLGHVPNRWFLSDLELLGEPAFRERYRPWAFAVDAPGLEKIDYDEEEAWTRATGLALHARPEALGRALAEGGGERLTLVAFLRRDSERARGLAAHGISLQPLLASLVPEYDPVCQERSRLGAAVPCDDGLVNQACHGGRPEPRSRPGGNFAYERWAPPDDPPLRLTELEGEVAGRPPEPGAALASWSADELDAWRVDGDGGAVVYRSPAFGAELQRTARARLTLTPGGSRTIEIVNLPGSGEPPRSERARRLWGTLLLPIEQSPDAQGHVRLEANLLELARGTWSAAEEGARLNRLEVRLPGADGAAARLERLELVDDAAQFEHAAAERTRLELDGIIRPGWFVRGGASVGFTVRVPLAQPRLRWHDGGTSAAGRRSVHIEVDGRRSVLWHSGNRNRGWSLVEVSLERWAGRRVRIELRTERDGVGFFGDPRLLGPSHRDVVPDVLVVLIDTLRADALGAWGYPGESASPTLDRLAREGVLFGTAISTSSWTKPAIPSLMTSLWPTTHRVGARSATELLPPSVPTVQGRFRLAGWRTGSFSASVFGSTLSGLDRDFDAAVPPRRWAGEVDEIGHPTTEQLAQDFLRWVDQEPDLPFFAYLHTLEVHQYWTPRYKQTEATGSRTAYRYAIRDQDAQLARLLQELERRGRLETTLIAVVSDHGEAFGAQQIEGNGHGIGLEQHQVHIPLFFWAGRALPPMTVNDPVSLVDLSPTLLDLAGLEILEDAHGVSLKPYIDGRRFRARDHTPSARLWYMHLPDAMELHSVVTASLEKLISRADGWEWQYDLDRDPCETRPVASGRLSAQTSQWLERWREEQAQQAQTFVRLHATDGEPSVPGSDIAQLRALGYIE
jgi:arylsulfatase A-like enzyme